MTARPAVVIALLALVVFVMSAIVPAWYWDGGLVEIEATTFIRQYLDERGLAEKLFDPRRNDWGMYQARELSHAADYLDARALDVLRSFGIDLFVPASAIVSALLTLALVLLATRRFSFDARLLSMLLLLTYVSGYVHLVTMGVFYRSAKPLLLPAIMAAVFYLSGVLSPVDGRKARPLREPAAVFALFCVMGLLDRVGFFYAAAATLALIVHALWTRRRRDLAAAGGAAFAALLIYNAWIAPLAIYASNGYWPDFSYQRVPLGELLIDPLIPAKAGILTVESFGLLFGGLAPWLVAIGGAAAGLWALVRRTALPLLVGIAGLVAAQVVLETLMMIRLPVIYIDFDNRLWYYPLPFQALIVALMIVLIGRRAAAARAMRVRLATVLLVCLTGANVASWAGWRDQHLQGQWWFRETLANTSALKASLVDGKLRPELAPEYRALASMWLRTRKLEDPD